MVGRLTRGLLVALAGAALAACPGRGTSGPAWPRSAGTDPSVRPGDDGGQTIEPLVVSESAAALEKAEDVAAEPEPSADDPPDEATAGEATAGEAAADPDDVPQGEVEIHFEELDIDPEEIEVDPEPDPPAPAPEPDPDPDPPDAPDASP